MHTVAVIHRVYVVGWPTKDHDSCQREKWEKNNFKKYERKLLRLLYLFITVLSLVDYFTENSMN